MYTLEYEPITPMYMSFDRRCDSTGCILDARSSGVHERYRNLPASAIPSKRFNRQRRSIMVDGKSNENLHILGRTSKQTSMVSRYTQNFTSRSNLRLFEPAFNGRTPRSVWFTKMKLDFERFQSITCSQCVNYLAYIFDASDHQIIISNLTTTPAKFLVSLPSIATMPAKDIGPLHFNGGPPSSLRLYKGSLLTILLDHLFQAAVTNNKKILKRLQSTTLTNG